MNSQKSGDFVIWYKTGDLELKESVLFGFHFSETAGRGKIKLLEKFLTDLQIFNKMIYSLCKSREYIFWKGEEKLSDAEKVAKEIQEEIKKMLFSEVPDRQHNIMNFYYNFLNDSNIKFEHSDGFENFVWFEPYEFIPKFYNLFDKYISKNMEEAEVLHYLKLPVYDYHYDLPKKYLKILDDKNSYTATREFIAISYYLFYYIDDLLMIYRKKEVEIMIRKIKESLNENKK